MTTLMAWWGRTPGCLLALFLMLGPAWAVQPDEMLADPALEARARALSDLIRCPVCQGENIDDSNAPIAHDLRLLVRERLLAGDTDQEVLDHIVARYGEFVLYKPRLGGGTLLLWFGPLVLVLAGGALVYVLVKRGGKREAIPVDDKQEW